MPEPIRFYIANRALRANGWLSNLWVSPFLLSAQWRLMADEFSGSGEHPFSGPDPEAGPMLDFQSVEHAYQWMKPMSKFSKVTGRNDDIPEWIRNAPFPRNAASAGHHLSAYDMRPDWNSIKVAWMRVCLRHKFRREDEICGGEDLVEKLLATGEAELIEAGHGTDKTSRFWGEGGICKCRAKWKEHPEAGEGGTKGCGEFIGNGENTLGRLLVQIRDELKGGACSFI